MEKRCPPYQAIVASVLGCTCAIVILWIRISANFDLHYSDSALPMLTEADGYFYLAKAQALLAGKAAWFQIPLLSLLGAAVHLVTHLPLETVAFWLPLAITSLAGVLLQGWGKLLLLPRSAVVTAAFLSPLIPAYLERGGPGWYDTDPGVALLFHGALLATAWVSFAPGRPRLAHVLWGGLCLVLLGWWWKPGAVAVPLCLFLWGVTFSWARPGLWRRLRLATGFFVVAAGGSLWILPASLFPLRLLPYREYLFQHLDIVLNGSKALVFRSIDELEPFGVLAVLKDLGGVSWAGGVALCALVLLLWRKPRSIPFFVPSLLCIALAFYAKRFLFLAALPLALGVGMLPETLPTLRPVSRFLTGRPRADGLLAWALCLLVLASCVQDVATRPLRFLFQRPQDRLVQALRQAAPADAHLWNWWDDGYFLAARSGISPLFDGGSQTPRMCFIAAHPLVATDPVLARRWIRFFALRGEDGLLPLLAAWGDEATVWQRLEDVFSASDPEAVLAAQPRLPDAQWLFPKGRVFLYLPQRFLKLSKWWIAMGRAPVPDGRPLRPHIDTFDRTGFSYTPGESQVSLPEAAVKKGYTEFGDVFVTSRTPLVPPCEHSRPGPYIVVSDRSPWLYIVDEEALCSIGFRLLAPGGASLPGFIPVHVDYAHGGVWEVLP